MQTKNDYGLFIGVLETNWISRLLPLVAERNLKFIEKLKKEKMKSKYGPAAHLFDRIQ